MKKERVSKRRFNFKLLVSVIIAALMIFLAFKAHTAASQDEKSWYFPLALFLSPAAALLFYVRIPFGKITGCIYTVLMAIMAPFLAFIIVESYNKGFWHVGAALSTATAQPPYLMIILNYLIYAFFFLFLAFAAGTFWLGYGIAVIVFMILAIVNFYVVKFRGSPLMPWDLLSVRTAGNVAGNFQYTIYWKMLFATYAFIFLFILCLKMRGKIEKAWIRFPALLASAAVLISLIVSLQSMDVKKFWGVDTTLFTPNVRYTKNGFVVAYLANLHLIHIDKPEGYSPERAEKIADEAHSAYIENTSEAPQEAKDKSTETLSTIENSAKALSTRDKSTEALSTKDKSTEALSMKDKSTEQQLMKGEDSGLQAESMEYDLSQAPNIIVIMNEAFSDLSVIGDFNSSEDYMPFFRSMMDKYTSGHLMVSVKGGNTANTEYEFLSGDTMAFLPEGSVVFQQYISSPVPTLASYLHSLGYTSIGMHPYQGSGWDRNRVYPLMGFDRFYDQRYFKNAKTIRKYISDESAYDRIIEEFESKEKGEKQFIFEVTMQNHSGYMANPSTDNGFRQEILLTDKKNKSSSVVAAERYLTLIKKSDEAFEKLISYFEENVSEPVIIVAFGDHEPNDYVTDVIDALTGYDPEGGIEEYQKHYQVPFFIWNNFGIGKDETVDLMSVNYISAYILEKAGMPMTKYQEYLMNLYKSLPVVCAGTYIDNEGSYHDWNKLSSDQVYGDMINDYNILTYNHLFDKKGRVDRLFEDPAA